MAGLDGIQNRIDPGEPLDKDIYDLPPEELGKCAVAAGQPGRGPHMRLRTTTSFC